MDFNISTGAQPPGTPRKQEVFRRQFNDIFLALSATYGLDFTLPDPTKSPSKRRRVGDRVENIYWRLTYQHHQRRLPEVLDTFREKAIEISRQWGPGPCSGSLVSMVAGVRPAATPQEKDQLIQLLQDVLQEFRPAPPPAAFGASLSRSLVSDAIPLDLGSSRSVRKRVPHAPHQPPPKRAKSTSPEADAAPQGIFVAGPATRSATKTPRAPSRLSMHSSKASCGVNDTVFSHDATTPFSTQTTNEASSQEQKRLPHRAPSSQCSYGPSSSSLQAMNQSMAAVPEDPGYPELPPCPGDDSSDWSDSEDGSFPVTAADSLMRKVSQSAAEPAKGPAEVLEESLDSVWLHTPLGLSEAPWIIIWEVMRVCCALGLDPRVMSFSYRKAWNDQKVFWDALAKHDQLQPHTLPEACHFAAWAAGVDEKSKVSCSALTFSASLVYSPQKWPLFGLRLKPPRLDLPHRLDRRFGSDRFLELIVPALDSKKNPPSMKALEAKMSLIVKEWLVKKSHKFLDRTWAAFFAREEQDRKTKKAGRARANPFETPSEAARGHRLYLFAQDGNGFVSGSGQAASATTGLNRHIKMSRDELAEWLLQVSRNQDQPIMKLSSRFSLGLSRTQPTVVLEKREIKNRKKDRLSESGNVMNDGIGRLSDSLARKIRDHLGLAEVPTGFQGRIGSGKGFWIRDTKGRPEDWIEVYPSQRKWQCDLGDEEHRTVEVLETVGPLKPAHLNTQFLDILEDRAKDKEKMRKCIGDLLRQSLKKDIEEQKNAMENPLLFRFLAQENTGSRHREGLVTYVGGLPERSDDQMKVLLDAGFEPKRLLFLSELSLKAQRDKCEETKKRMNIRIGCSTYAFMVVDFLGVLEENEVHLGFSSSFKDEQTGFCETFVHGMDVLVARSPAHYPSDIQKVKAVFKPELGSLKDVVIFSKKGRTALADKLSGGDYDGDKAWVCWHQDIVTNFENAAVPPIPDLFKEGFLSKQTKTYQELRQQYGDQASSKFFEQSLLFNMEPAYVGRCTNFKESFCYREGTVGSEAAIRLSTLLSNLVDQSKQGIEFSSADWTRFSRPLLGSGPSPPKPAYKFDSYKGAMPSKDVMGYKHIIDYLKFGVLLPVVEEELKRLHGVDGGPEPPVSWDPDLAKLASIWMEIKDKHPEVAPLLDQLDTDLEGLREQWLVQVPDTSFQSKVLGLNSRFLSIQPREPAGILGEVIRRGCLPGEYSVWSLLKASTLFKKFYMKGSFVWWVAGRQLCMLKGCMQTNEAHKQVSNDHLPMVVRPDMYAALRADGKYIRSRTSKTGGHAWGIAEDAQESSDVDTDGYFESG